MKARDQVVGVIGLGVMGSGVAARLIECGFARWVIAVSAVAEAADGKAGIKRKSCLCTDDALKIVMRGEDKEDKAAA